MNNQNPLVPQGSLLEQKAKVRSRLPLAVVLVAGIHVIGFSGLLLVQGCKDKTPGSDLPPTMPMTPSLDTAPSATTTALPPLTPAANPTSSLPPLDSTALPPVTPDATLPPAGTMTPTTTTGILPPVPPLTGESTPPAMGGKYKIQKGDSFASIAPKHGTTWKAIEAANPGVDSRKLKINQEINLPAPTAKPADSGTAAPGAVAATTGSTITYKVKSGDTLGKLAKKHGTSVNAIRAASGLKSNTIRVGQTLKIPTKAAAPVAPVLPAATPAAEPPPISLPPATPPTTPER